MKASGHPITLSLTALVIDQRLAICYALSWSSEDTAERTIIMDTMNKDDSECASVAV